MPLDLLQVAVILLGITLGWLVIFGVRRYRVQWGAFASFMSIVAGTTLIKFLYASDLLPYYAIGLFAGFFGNMAVRAAGTIVGGKVGEGLLEISMYREKVEAAGADDVGRGSEDQSEA